jgi:hypothetical protein
LIRASRSSARRIVRSFLTSPLALGRLGWVLADLFLISVADVAGLIELPGLALGNAVQRERVAAANDLALVAEEPERLEIASRSNGFK